MFNGVLCEVEIPREHFPRSILVASSRRCHEDVTSNSGVSGVSDEDASDLSATVVRVGLVDFGERHDTRTNRQHYTRQQTAGRPIR